MGEDPTPDSQQDELLAMLSEADLRQLGTGDATQLLVLQSLHRRIEALEAQVRNLRATRPRTIHEDAIYARSTDPFHLHPFAGMH
jgi:hypothetical protein